MRLWTLGEIAQSLGISGSALSCSQDTVITEVSTDTRTIKSGSLFVPLVGESFDGHDYAQKAISKGAAAILWGRPEKPCWSSESKVQLLEVADTTKAYQKLGLAHRIACGVRCVAITGSVGKTTTKEFLAHLLAGQMKVHKSEKNFNNDIGVPLTLLGLKPEHDLVIVEMGMRGPGQIERLVEAARPEIGLITSIGTSHLEILGTRENIARAKAELVAGLPSDGRAILPAEDDFLALLQEFAKAPVLSFGLAKGQVHPESIEDFAQNGTSFFMGGIKRMLLLPGRHHLVDLMAALAAGLALGADLEAMLAQLISLDSSLGRARWLNLEGARIYLDAYNAAPESMRASLEVVAGGKGRKIAVLGDMLELGSQAAQAHKQLGQELKSFAIDLALCYGPLSRYVVEEAKVNGVEAYHFEDKEELTLKLASLLSYDTTILIKASRGMALETVIESLEKAMPA